jgi:hypothetical protein
MNLLFSNNNRFSALLNDSDETINNIRKKNVPDNVPQNNHFKSSTPIFEKRNSNNVFFSNKKLREENIKKEKEYYAEIEQIKRQKEIEEATNPFNFPELSNVEPSPSPSPKLTKVVQLYSNICYADKIRITHIDVTPDTNSQEIIKLGWGSVTKVPKTNKFIYNYGKSHYPEKQENPIDALNAMVDVYERNIKHYDALWGEGTYNEHYKFKNYDYEYFDKLDEQYEDELKKEEDNDYYLSDNEY